VGAGIGPGGLVDVSEEAYGAVGEVELLRFEEGLHGAAAALFDESEEDGLAPSGIEGDVVVEATGIDDEVEEDQSELGHTSISVHVKVGRR